MSDPILKANLKEEARSKICFDRNSGRMIGMTYVSIDQGLMTSQIKWGIDGNDYPVSPEVAAYVEGYEIYLSRTDYRAAGIYVLRDKEGKNVLARARVRDYNSRKDASELFVSGADRKAAVKLYNLICAGKIRPDIEYKEFRQIEGAANELRRLRRENASQARMIENRDETIRALTEQLSMVRRQISDAQAAAARQ